MSKEWSHVQIPVSLSISSRARRLGAGGGQGLLSRREHRPGQRRRRTVGRRRFRLRRRRHRLKAFAGFRFSDWLGARGQLHRLRLARRQIFDDDDVEADADALDGFVVGFLPDHDLRLFAQGGPRRWDRSFDIDDLDIHADDDGTDSRLRRRCAQFRLGSAAFRAEYEKFEFGDDADMLSIGFSWTFF